MDRELLEVLLSHAFRGGERTRRELRLSREEHEYLRQNYPHFRLTPMEVSGEKRWYDISLKEA